MWEDQNKSCDSSLPSNNDHSLFTHKAHAIDESREQLIDLHRKLSHISLKAIRALMNANAIRARGITCCDQVAGEIR